MQRFCHLMQVEDKLLQTIRVGGHWDIGWPVSGAEIRQHPLHKRMSGLFARSRCAVPCRSAGLMSRGLRASQGNINNFNFGNFPSSSALLCAVEIKAADEGLKPRQLSTESKVIKAAGDVEVYQDQERPIKTRTVQESISFAKNVKN